MRNILINLSWKNVNLFLQCKRCFYKEFVLKRKRPQLDPDCFSLNNAVDQLWKKEFDHYRSRKIPHPIMIQNNIKAIPYYHESITKWRDFRFGGISYVDYENGFKIFGVIDDIWLNEKNELIIVDFKATAKSLDSYLYNNFNTNFQLSFYAGIFKRLGYTVGVEGYFIYSIALKDKQNFNQSLEFKSIIKPCLIDDTWIDHTLMLIRNCLQQEMVPKPSHDCKYCNYDLVV